MKKFFGDIETNYLDGFQYKSTKPSEGSADGGFDIVDPNEVAVMKLRIIPTSEGYFDALTNQYIYNYTDHLGNVRLSYSDTNKDGIIQPRQYNMITCTGGTGPFDPPMCIDNWKPGEIVEVNNYYPFGLLHNYTATTQNPYQLKYNGKEIQETGMYDYGARFYMPDIGRWGVIDPLAEASRRLTPYHYGNNNPIRFIDPDGRLTMDNLSTYSRGSAVAGFMNKNGFGDDYLPMLYSDDAGMMIVNEALGENGQGGGGGSIYNLFNGDGVGFDGIYAQQLYRFFLENITTSGQFNIKGFHFVMESRTPNIYKHTLNSFLKGYPQILHYDTDSSRRKNRRTEALRGKDYMRTKGVTSLDEYPYASTFEGGENANIEAVPIIEQSYQGTDLWWQVYSKLRHGDAFMVIPVPRDEKPETAKQRSLSRLPQSIPQLAPMDSPGFSRPAVPYNAWPVVLGAGVAIGVSMYLRFVPIP